MNVYLTHQWSSSKNSSSVLMWKQQSSNIRISTLRVVFWSRVSIEMDHSAALSNGRGQQVLHADSKFIIVHFKSKFVVKKYIRWLLKICLNNMDYYFITGFYVWWQNVDEHILLRIVVSIVPRVDAGVEQGRCPGSQSDIRGHWAWQGLCPVIAVHWLAWVECSWVILKHVNIVLHFLCCIFTHWSPGSFFCVF